MKTRIIIFLALITASFSFSQATYIDVITPATTALAYAALKNEQNDTNKKLKKIEEAQLVINLQLARVNNVQNKIRKGLTEVNGTLNNGVMIQKIGRNSVKCYETFDKISAFLSENPEFSPFAVPQVNRMYVHIVESYAHASSAVTSDNFNWMNAGQRHNILNKVDIDIRTLNLLAHSTLAKLQRAKRLGFLRSLNPFRTWANGDLQIVRGVMSNYERLVM